jgi:hypothetical protein
VHGHVTARHAHEFELVDAATSSSSVHEYVTASSLSARTCQSTSPSIARPRPPLRRGAALARIRSCA